MSLITTSQKLDKIAVRYHGADTLKDKHIEDAYQSHALPWIFKQITGCREVLEMGYGEGYLTRELVRRKFRVTLVEGSEILCGRAKRLFGERIYCERALFESYTPGKRFDAVIASHVFEHVDDPVRLLRRMRGWLSKTGKIVILVPNKESIHRQLAVLMGLQKKMDALGVRDKLVGHQRVYSITTLEKDVRRAGFKPLAVEGFFLKTLPNSRMLNYSPQLLKALNRIAFVIPDQLLANIGMTLCQK